MRYLQHRMDAIATSIIAKHKQAMMQDHTPKYDLLHALLNKESEGFVTMDEVKSIVMALFAPIISVDMTMHAARKMMTSMIVVQAVTVD
ncbi:hypothetical protein GOP47_0009154 [Adiantum capillus-veneris]|uniref:Uncharacterized protein n=1 Tax=Adiantum capillus-veneris TaxID=13818 RepID=A0A9D4UX03_ADICA|nr:hypothetical protein GOP47_0009154 [Adiantum capillus-veneris]